MLRVRYTENYEWLDPADKLGKGASGVVFKCRHRKTGEAYAVKCYPNSKSSLKKEYEVLRKLGKIAHPNVMQMIYHELEKTDPAKSHVIIMDYCAGGSLSEVLEMPENNCGLSEDELILFISDIVAALEYLREKQIVHRDIKPGNILKYISPDGQTYYRLSDFDMAREASDDQNLMSIRGTDEYLHPEMYDKAYNFPNKKLKPGHYFSVYHDLYSLGVTLYQMATGKLPFCPYLGRNDKQTMHKIQMKKPPDAISGVQNSSNGHIEYSKKLPASCRLSAAFQKRLTRLLRILLHDTEFTFSDLFKWAADLRQMRFLEVFVLSSCTFDRVYVPSSNAESKTAQDYADLVRFYIHQQYSVPKQECDLLLPLITQQQNAPGSSNAALPSEGSLLSNEISFNQALVNSSDIEATLQSCETVRLRVALGDFGNRRNAIYLLTQLDAMKITSGAKSASKQIAIPTAWLVALHRIDVARLKSDKTYVDDCVKRLSQPETLRASLDAQIALSNRQVSSNSAGDRTGYYVTLSRAGFSYTAYRASLAFADAQALMSACRSHLASNTKRNLCRLKLEESTLSSLSSLLVEALKCIHVLVDARMGAILSLEGRSGASPDTAKQLQQLKASLEKTKEKFKALESKEVKKREDVLTWMREYYSLIVEKDQLNRTWCVMSSKSHCFGRFSTACQYGRQMSSSTGLPEVAVSSVTEPTEKRPAVANPALDETDTPCWKILQHNYELCSEVFASFQKNRTETSHWSTQNACDIAPYTKLLMKELTESSTSRVISHCWVKTVSCYTNFLEWWKDYKKASAGVSNLQEILHRWRLSLRELSRRINELHLQMQKILDFPILILLKCDDQSEDAKDIVNATDSSTQTDCDIDTVVISSATERLKNLMAAAESQFSLINAAVDERLVGNEGDSVFSSSLIEPR